MLRGGERNGKRETPSVAGDFTHDETSPEALLVYGAFLAMFAPPPSGAGDQK